MLLNPASEFSKADTPLKIHGPQTQAHNLQKLEQTPQQNDLTQGEYFFGGCW